MPRRFPSIAAVLATSLLLHADAGLARADLVPPPPATVEARYDPSDAIMFNPLAIALGLAIGVGYVSFEYQHAFSDSIGLSLIPGFAYMNLNEVEAYGVALEAGPRLLLSGDRLHGWLLYPFVGYAYAAGENTATHETAAIHAFQVGLDFGYQWTWAPGFALGLQLGVAYAPIWGDFSGDSVGVPMVISPRLAVKLGYAW